MYIGVSEAGVSYGCRKTVGFLSVSLASRLMIHVIDEACDTSRVIRKIFFIAGKGND